VKKIAISCPIIARGWKKLVSFRLKMINRSIMIIINKTRIIIRAKKILRMKIILKNRKVGNNRKRSKIKKFIKRVWRKRGRNKKLIKMNINKNLRERYYHFLK
jgi:hypothetical protein